MTIRTWDFQDCSCGKSHKSTVCTEERIPEKIKCSCGKKVGWSTMSARAQINLTSSGRNYGKYWPQYGCIVEDYNHRLRLEKETGVVEVGRPETHAEIAEDIAQKQARQSKERDPAVFVADSIEELMEQIPRDQIDSVHTGNSLNQPLQEGLGFKL